MSKQPGPIHTRVAGQIAESNLLIEVKTQHLKNSWIAGFQSSYYRVSGKT